MNFSKKSSYSSIVFTSSDHFASVMTKIDVERIWLVKNCPEFHYKQFVKREFSNQITLFSPFFNYL